MPREEIFLHTDRDIYVSGEEMWFKLYLIDRRSSGLSLNSRIAYVELLNAGNRPVIQKRILLNQGAGSGQLMLPDSLSSGTYTLRAYTGWMKNFLPENCFMKDITVYNSLIDKVFKGKTRIEHNSAKGNAKMIPDPDMEKAVDLSIDNSGKDSLVIVAEPKNKAVSEYNNILFVLIQTRGNIEHLSSVKVEEGKARMAFCKKFPAGGHPSGNIF